MKIYNVLTLKIGLLFTILMWIIMIKKSSKIVSIRFMIKLFHEDKKRRSRRRKHLGL